MQDNPLWFTKGLQYMQRRRRLPEYINPPIRAYYWDGSAPTAHRLREIDMAGAYLYTAERWYVGTIVLILFQGDVPLIGDGGLGGRALAVHSRVVGHGEDGVALEFLFLRSGQREALRRFLAGQVRPSPESGQALVELALLIPLLFLLIVNAVNFGGFLFDWITIANAARAGSQYAVRGAATVSAPTLPTAAQITTMVTQDISSLLNRGSLQVRVCTNNNGTVTCAGTGSGSTPADPEPLSFILTAVDVKYTYTPFIPLWNFPGLGIHATLPPTTIHRRTLMRILQ